MGYGPWFHGRSVAAMMARVSTASETRLIDSAGHNWDEPKSARKAGRDASE